VNEASTPPETTQPAAPKRIPSALWHVLIVVLVGIVAFAGSLGNRALLHHEPSPIASPLIDDGMLQGTRHFGSIFRQEFLLRTVIPDAETGVRSEYRPLGYAVFALARGVMHDQAVAGWHVFFLVLHLATALVVYALIRSLAGAGPALGLGVLYASCPLFLPLINDPNMIYIGVGLLFSALTLLCVQLFLKRGAAGWLALSVPVYIAALLTFRPALTLPAFVTALCLLHETRPRLAAAMLVWLALAAPAVILLGLRPWQAGLALTAVTAAIGIGVGRAPLRRWAQVLPLYIVIGAGMLAGMGAVKQELIHEVICKHVLSTSRLSEPCLASFSAKALLRMSGFVVAVLFLAVIAPLALFLKKPRARSVAFVVIAIAFLGVAIPANRLYRTDSGYWEAVLAALPGEQRLARYNLGAAYCAEGKWSEARNLLMDMKYTGEPQYDMTQALADILLSKAYYALGEEKIAAYYCFAPVLAEARYAKSWLSGKAEMAMELGYVSCGESGWANALIMDPFDLDLRNKLGMGLVYKNFFRAARKYFDYVLSLDPDNETALYYQAFIAELGKDDRGYARFRREWQAAARTDGDLDFRPVYARYARFDAEKAGSWVGPEPLGLVRRQSDDPAMYYVLFFGTGPYPFPEVPLDAGKFRAASGVVALQNGNADEAARHFRSAASLFEISYRIAPTRTAVELIIAAYRELNEPVEIRRYERILESMSDEN